MSARTNIEWATHQWNPIVGCAIASKGCANCYAMRMAGTRLAHTRLYAGLTEGSNAGPAWNGKTRLIEERLADPLRWRQPRERVFVNSMGDLFAESVPDEWIDRVFAVMALAPKHTFIVLTKRAERMRRYFMGIEQDGQFHEGWRDALIEGTAQSLHHAMTGEDPSAWLAVHLPLPNVWLGVSAEDQRRADERIPLLLDTPAAVRFVSCEPLLGPIALHAVPGVAGRAQDLHWVICGGESGPGARVMRPAWAEAIMDQCAAVDIPFFMKQMARRAAPRYRTA